MNSRRMAALVAVTILPLLAACGGGAAVTEGGANTDPVAEESANTQVEAVDLRFSTASTPEQHHTKAAYRFAELVEELSDGSVTVEVFDSGSLYDQTSEQQALVAGQLDMAYTSPEWLSERVPAISILTVPYLVDGADHLYAVMESDLGQGLIQSVVDEAGVRVLTTLTTGTRQLNLNDSVGKVMTPADLEGVNLRVPNAPAWIRMGEALGANPTPVAFNELYLALQTGTVQGQDNPLATTIDAKFYEVTSQISLTGHLAGMVMPAINEEVWQSLTSGQQEAIQTAWVQARDYGTEVAQKEESEAVEFLKSEGLDVYEPDREAFREHVLAQYLDDEELTGQWPEGALDAIEELR